MKINSTRLLFTGLLMGLATLSALAEDCFMYGGVNYKVLNSTQCEVVKLAEGKYAGNIVIPESAGGYTVIGIAANAMRDCKEVVSLALPKTTEYIGKNAFDSATSLATLDLGGTKIISDYAFWACPIVDLTIPASVDSIGYGAFVYNDALKNLYFEDSKTPIRFYHGNYNFQKSALNTLYCGRPLPDGKFKIGEAKALETVTFGETVTSIPADFAYGCESLVAINFSGNETKIGDNAFRDCLALPSLVIPESVKHIGASAFDSNTSLSVMTLGKNIEVIADYAFWKCPIVDLTIPASVDSIGYGAFVYNDALKNLYFEDSKTPIKFYKSNYNFQKSALKTLYCGRPLPNGDFKIGEAKALETVTFGEAVTSIPADFAYGCKSLVAINFSGNETKIGDNAFRDCFALPSLVIPESVKHIGASAFDSNTSLSVMTLGKNVEVIADYAFWKCPIVNLTIPASVDSIGYGAFVYNDNLKNLYFEDAETPIKFYKSNYNFQKKHLKTIFCGRPMPDESFKIGEAENLEVLYFGNAVTSIPNNFAYGCKNLVQIVFSENEKSIGDNAFRDCASLAAVMLPKAMVTLGSSVFDGCTSLAQITLRDKVQSIGRYAFYACPLTSLVSQNLVPPTVENSNFVDSNIYKNAILYVPEEATAAYKGAAIWKDFFNFGIDGIASAVSDSNNIRVSGNTILIEGNPVNVKVYDISGRNIFQGVANEVPVSGKGVYMIIIDNTVYKIAVK